MQSALYFVLLLNCCYVSASLSSVQLFNCYIVVLYLIDQSVFFFASIY